MSLIPLALLLVSLVLGAATTNAATGSPEASGTLWMQVVLAAMVALQMIVAGATKLMERRWAEQDRLRAEETLRKATTEVKEELGRKLDENTAITLKNNHHEEKVAAALSIFDKLLDRMPAKPSDVPDLRELLHEGGEGRTKAADRPPGS